MPLEIRELHIRAVVGSDGEQTAAPKKTAQHEEERESIVAECVAQVLEILRQRSER